MSATSIHDVVFVVENSPVNGSTFEEMLHNYILPTLGHFKTLSPSSNGPDTTITSSSSYSLVLFRTSDCIPGLSAFYQGPFLSTGKLCDSLSRIDFSGGLADFKSLGAEGLALALVVLDNIAKRRQRVRVSYSQFIIYVANSDIHSVPVMDIQEFLGASIFDLSSIVRQRGIRLSVFSPRKLPFLCRLFNFCGGDFSDAFTFATADPTHLVLLNGFRIPAGVVSETIPPKLKSSRPSSRPINGVVDEFEQDLLLEELFDILDIPSGSGQDSGTIPVTPAAVQALDETPPLTDDDIINSLFRESPPKTAGSQTSPTAIVGQQQQVDLPPVEPQPEPSQDQIPQDKVLEEFPLSSPCAAAEQSKQRSVEASMLGGFSGFGQGWPLPKLAHPPTLHVPGSEDMKPIVVQLRDDPPPSREMFELRVGAEGRAQRRKVIADELLPDFMRERSEEELRQEYLYMQSQMALQLQHQEKVRQQEMPGLNHADPQQLPVQPQERVDSQQPQHPNLAASMQPPVGEKQPQLQAVKRELSLPGQDLQREERPKEVQGPERAETIARPTLQSGSKQDQEHLQHQQLQKNPQLQKEQQEPRPPLDEQLKAQARHQLDQSRHQQLPKLEVQPKLTHPAHPPDQQLQHQQQQQSCLPKSQLEPLVGSQQLLQEKNEPQQVQLLQQAPQMLHHQQPPKPPLPDSVRKPEVQLHLTHQQEQQGEQSLRHPDQLPHRQHQQNLASKPHPETPVARQQSVQKNQQQHQQVLTPGQQRQQQELQKVKKPEVQPHLTPQPNMQVNVLQDKNQQPQGRQLQKQHQQLLLLQQLKQKQLHKRKDQEQLQQPEVQRREHKVEPEKPKEAKQDPKLSLQPATQAVTPSTILTALDLSEPKPRLPQPVTIPGPQLHLGHPPHAPSPDCKVCKSRDVVWSGKLLWQDALNGFSYTVKVTAASLTFNGVPEVDATAWHPTIGLQFIKKSIIQELSGDLLHNSRQILIKPEPSESLDKLTSFMMDPDGFWGFCYLKNPGSTFPSMLLISAADNNSFVGFIPNKPEEVMEDIRKSQAKLMAQPVSRSVSAPAPQNVHSHQGVITGPARLPSQGASQQSTLAQDLQSDGKAQAATQPKTGGHDNVVVVGHPPVKSSSMNGTSSKKAIIIERTGSGPLVVKLQQPLHQSQKQDQQTQQMQQPSHQDRLHQTDLQQQQQPLVPQPHQHLTLIQRLHQLQQQHRLQMSQQQLPPHQQHQRLLVPQSQAQPQQQLQSQQQQQQQQLVPQPKQLRRIEPKPGPVPASDSKGEEKALASMGAQAAKAAKGTQATKAAKGTQATKADPNWVTPAAKRLPKAKKPGVVSNYNLRSHQRNVQQPPLQKQLPPQHQLPTPHLISQQQLPLPQLRLPGQLQQHQPVPLQNHHLRQQGSGQQHLQGPLQQSVVQQQSQGQLQSLQPGLQQLPGHQLQVQQLPVQRQMPGHQLLPGQQQLATQQQVAPVQLQPESSQEPAAAKAPVQLPLVFPRPGEQHPHGVPGPQRNVVHLVGSNPMVVSRSISTPNLLSAGSTMLGAGPRSSEGPGSGSGPATVLAGSEVQSRKTKGDPLPLKAKKPRKSN